MKNNAIFGFTHQFVITLHLVLKQCHDMMYNKFYLIELPIKQYLNKSITEIIGYRVGTNV